MRRRVRSASHWKQQHSQRADNRQQSQCGCNPVGAHRKGLCHPPSHQTSLGMEKGITEVWAVRGPTNYKLQITKLQITKLQITKLPDSPMTQFLLRLRLLHMQHLPILAPSHPDFAHRIFLADRL